MKKRQNKKLLFVGLFAILLLPVSFCLAQGLEVDYPTLKGESQMMSSNTPLEVYLKYIFDVGIFLGFFAVFGSLVYAGILYFFSPAIPQALVLAKDRLAGAGTGFIIITLLYLIMTTISPELAIFNFSRNRLNPPPPEQSLPRQTGIYFYNSADCSGDSQPNTTNVPDLDDLKNRINSFKIINNYDQNISYFSILFGSINYWGKCQYIKGSGCKKLGNSFPNSAAIYQLNRSPNGDGVYFFRKSCFNSIEYCKRNSGGWLKIDNATINASDDVFFSSMLKDLSFTGNSKNGDCTVPKEEQNCVLWENKEKNICKQRQCPTFAQDNVTSLKIAGNYAVLFIYYNLDEDEDVQSQGMWNFCQVFPTEDDANKDGPQQIKWENIRSIGKPANYMVIFTVK